MKNNKLSSLLIISIICLQSLAAQVISGNAPEGISAENNPYANFFQKWTPMMQELFQKVKNNDDVISNFVGAEIGSPYISEEFIPCKIYYKEELIGNAFYRLNAYNQEIELKKTKLIEEQTLALIKDKNLTILDNGSTLLLTSFKDRNNKIKDAYLIEIFKTKNHILYKREYVKYTEAKPAENSMVNPIPSRFTNYTDFLIKSSKNNIITELPSKKSKFIKMFSEDKSQQLKNFIKANNIDLKNEDDLIEIFKNLTQV